MGYTGAGLDENAVFSMCVFLEDWNEQVPK